ncbi:hypothetical protein [Paenibacillus apiarius]|uniref:hypothetical protein n=1 Tax=Paenibacillus apiarius TaxID=46240 RepID=UPI003B3ABE41
MGKFIDIAGRIWNGLIAVCTLSAILFGALFAIYLLTEFDTGWSVAFGTLFAAAFALGVMRRD